MDVDIKHLEGFTGLWIPEEILSDRNLSALEVLLYAEIHALTKNDKGYCFATNNYIAWRLRGVTGNSISKIISHLEKKNYISVKIIKLKSGFIKERQIKTLKTYSQNVHTPRQKGDTPPRQKGDIIDNSIIDNKREKKETPLLKLAPTQQENNSKYYIESTLLTLELYYKNAVIAIYNANDDPLPGKYSDFKNDLRAWKKLEPNPELVETIKTHFENIVLSARRAERFKEWQTWEVFFKDSDDWDDSDEIKERMKRNIFIPYIKRFDRYLQDHDWENVYLKLQEPFWFYMTPVMVEPLQKDLAKAGIKMELIQDLDYILTTRKELKQMSFQK